MNSDKLPAYYFTSDLHIGHTNVIQYDSRPFQNVEQHDWALAMKCRPSEEDSGRSPQLWILGDVARTAKDFERFASQVFPHWYKVHLIRGNHDDKAAWKLRDRFASAHEALYLRVNASVRIYLSHYAHRVWRNSHHGAFHLYGHSHGALPGIGRSMDVGVNVNSYAPVSLETVVSTLGTLDDTNHH